MACLLQAMSYQRLHAAQLTGYRRNEFDTTKFTSGLAYRTQSQYDLPSFGLDPDAPVFLSGYGPGGLPVNRSSHSPRRPDSALQVRLAVPVIKYSYYNTNPNSLLGINLIYLKCPEAIKLLHFLEVPTTRSTLELSMPWSCLYHVKSAQKIEVGLCSKNGIRS